MNSQETLVQDSMKSKTQANYIKVLLHYGQDKFHTQSWNSLLLKELWKLSINITSPNQKIHTAKPLNYQLPLHLDILLVFYVLLYLIQQILWFQRLIMLKQVVQLAKKSLKFMVKSDFLDYGEVWEQELSWWEP